MAKGAALWLNRRGIDPQNDIDLNVQSFRNADWDRVGLEAYLEGNKLFRRWEDLYKANKNINERNNKIYNTLLNKIKKGA